MNRLARIYSRFRNLILYGVIGAFTASLDFVVFTLLSRYAGLHYVVANCIGVVTGICTSFLLNRAYNFKVKDDSVRRFVIFLCVGLSGMLLSNLILLVCIERLGLGKTLSKLLSIGLVVVFQFLLNKYITFRSIKEKEKH